MRRWQLAIGGVAVDVRSDITDCIAILDAMLRLYATRGSGDAALDFRISRAADGMTLSVDDEILWRGLDAAEMAAGFEVHFYTRLLAALQPACLSIHAATVGLKDQAICLAGVSGAGKSSLCTAALLDGSSYLSDEFSLLLENGCVAPFPRPLQWGKQRHPAFRHAELRSAGFDKFLFRFPDYRGRSIGNLFWFPPRVAASALMLSTVVFPLYRPDADNRPKAMRRSQALMEIGTHMHHRLPPAELIRELNRRIPASCRFLSLPFNDARQAWNAVRQGIEG